MWRKEPYRCRLGKPSHPYESNVVLHRRNWSLHRPSLSWFRQKSPQSTVESEGQLINEINHILEAGQVTPFNQYAQLKNRLLNIQDSTREELRKLLQKDQEFGLLDSRKTLCMFLEDWQEASKVSQVGRLVALALHHPWLAVLLLNSSYPHLGEIRNSDEKVLVLKHLANVLTIAIHRRNTGAVKDLLQYDSEENVYPPFFLVGRYILAVRSRDDSITNLFQEHRRLNEATLSPRLKELYQEYSRYNDDKVHVFDGIPDPNLRKELGLTDAFQYKLMTDELNPQIPLILLRPACILECLDWGYERILESW
ncbi:hypothetical protein IWQ61_005317 [Dispira simplex]|nr:hypothetical protein IWQ61_005317 [Dispira simplex]